MGRSIKVNLSEKDPIDRAFNGLPGKFGYSLSKLAMNYYVEHFQSIFTSKQIRVNGILPESTNSGMTDEFYIAAGGDDNLL